MFYYLNNKWHRIGMPAINTTDNNCEWYFNGLPHRMNGLYNTRIFYLNGPSKFYVLYGKFIKKDVNTSRLVI